VLGFDSSSTVMANKDQKIVFQTKTKLDQYQVVDEVYTGRQSRVLYSGYLQTAQSGIPLDGDPTMLFEYNQRLMEAIEQLKPVSVLVIGGGIYSLPMAIRRQLPKTIINVVEPDVGLDDIAKQYFSFKPDRRLIIHHDYGLHYLKNSSESYDMVVLDAYSEDKVPDEILSPEFAKQLKKSLNRGGIVLMNVISNLSAMSPLNNMSKVLGNEFKELEIYQADGERTSYFMNTNYVMVAGRKIPKLDLRYKRLEN
jgi:spermidine synthase